MTTVWSDQHITKLRKLWGDGHTTGEIGKKLGVSKNAVVGKAHRLGLKSRPSPIKRVAKPQQEEKERIFTITDLSSSTCRWPIGDPKESNFRFCGATVFHGKSYCAEHCDLAYVGSGKNRSEDSS